MTRFTFKTKKELATSAKLSRSQKPKFSHVPAWDPSKTDVELFNITSDPKMTMTVEEGEEIVRLAQSSGKICSVNYCYSAYPMVREMRHMVATGRIGKVRLVKCEFAHGHHADATDADNPRVRWRYDPAQAGVSAQFADCGIHAMHMASFVTGQEVTTLSADTVSCIDVRTLEDDAMVNFRMDGGAVGRLWTSSIDIGRQHGLGIRKQVACRLTAGRIIENGWICALELPGKEERCPVDGVHQRIQRKIVEYYSNMLFSACTLSRLGPHQRTLLEHNFIVGKELKKV